MKEIDYKERSKKNVVIFYTVLLIINGIILFLARNSKRFGIVFGSSLGILILSSIFIVFILQKK